MSMGLFGLTNGLILVESSADCRCVFQWAFTVLVVKSVSPFFHVELEHIHSVCVSTISEWPIVPNESVTM